MNIDEYKQNNNNKEKTVQNENDDATFITNAIRGIMVLLVPLAGIIGAYYSTRAALESDIRSLRQDIEYLRKSTDMEFVRLNQSISGVRDELSRHSAMGVGGIPHPSGTIVEIERIDERLKRLEQKIMP